MAELAPVPRFRKGEALRQIEERRISRKKASCARVLLTVAVGQWLIPERAFFSHLGFVGLQFL